MKRGPPTKYSWQYGRGARAARARSRWIADVAGVRNTKKACFRLVQLVPEQNGRNGRRGVFAGRLCGKNPRPDSDGSGARSMKGWHRSRYDRRENGKFSMGMDSIARCIRKAGMVPGVWLCPVNPEVMPFEAGFLRRAFPGHEWHINYAPANRR
ncbi:MAG: hypothetical protein ACLTZY_07995 [Alistipes indistinctus]